MEKHIKNDTFQNWKYLLNEFSPERIEQWTISDIDKYVVGKGRTNKSFCYLVESGTKELGEIRGANSSKFGLWYGKFGEDRTDRYRATKKHFDGDIGTAFSKIKTELSSLIRKAKSLSEYKEIKSIFSDMFKRKIVFLYNKECMIPSFILEDLVYFEKSLSLTVDDTFEKAQRTLLNYKKAFYSSWTNLEFGCFLYGTFGKNKIKEQAKANEYADFDLNEAAVKVKKIDSNYKPHPVKKKKLLQVKDGVYIYPRNPKVAAIALNNANYKCELDDSHESFIRKKGDIRYTEVHHLVPLSKYDEFDVDLDVPANIVSLCSHCHNEIHYGKNYKDLVRILYNKRKQALLESGIDLSLEELLKMYK